MINVNEKYKQACDSSTLSGYYIAKYGVYNKEAKSYIKGISGSENVQPFSSIKQTYDEIKENDINYISCEPNRVKLNGSFAFIQNKSIENTNQKTGCWLKTLSNENGLFATNPKIEYNFSNYLEFTNLTLCFQEVCKELKVYYYSDTTLLYTRHITNNDKLIFETTDTTIEKPIFTFNKLIIEFIATAEPFRYIKFNEIDFGVYEIFNKDQIKNIKIINELSIKSDDIFSSSCNISIKDTNGDYNILNPYNKLGLIQEKQELTVYHYLKVGNTYVEVPLGTFLLKNFNYSNMTLELECYDDIYFMNNVYYSSPFYKNVSATQILTDLFNSMNYSSSKYEIDESLNNVMLTGYIPNVEYREALRLILEASCATISKNEYGKIKIFKILETQNPVKYFSTSEVRNNIPAKNIYDEKIDVFEYTYAENSIEEIIYSKILNSGEYIIDFEKYPIQYDRYKDDFQLLKNDTPSKGNYTILSLSPTSCKVKVYITHVLVELKAFVYTELKNKKTCTTGKPNVDYSKYSSVEVDNHLISTLNSSEVGNWKLERNAINYSFNTNIKPYLQIGDKCVLELGYKTKTSISIVNLATIIPNKYIRGFSSNPIQPTYNDSTIMSVLKYDIFSLLQKGYKKIMYYLEKKSVKTLIAYSSEKTTTVFCMNYDQINGLYTQYDVSKNIVSVDIEKLYNDDFVYVEFSVNNNQIWCITPPLPLTKSFIITKTEFSESIKENIDGE